MWQDISHALHDLFSPRTQADAAHACALLLAAFVRSKQQGLEHAPQVAGAGDDGSGGGGGHGRESLKAGGAAVLWERSESCGGDDSGVVGDAVQDGVEDGHSECGDGEGGNGESEGGEGGVCVPICVCEAARLVALLAGAFPVLTGDALSHVQGVIPSAAGCVADCVARGQASGRNSACIKAALAAKERWQQIFY